MTFGRLSGECKLRDGLSIQFTNRDQRNIFGDCEFRKFCIFLGTAHSCCMFLSVQINAVFLSVLYFQQYFWIQFNHKVLQ